MCYIVVVLRDMVKELGGQVHYTENTLKRVIWGIGLV